MEHSPVNVIHMPPALLYTPLTNLHFVLRLVRLPSKHTVPTAGQVNLEGGQGKRTLTIFSTILFAASITSSYEYLLWLYGK